MITQNYRNAYKEVYIILQYLKDEEYQKIPQNIIDAIEENMNEEYMYEIDEDEDLANQPMLLETKATLFNLFRDYLSTPEQRTKIIRMQSEDRIKAELQKQEKYNVDNLFANNQPNRTAQTIVQPAITPVDNQPVSLNVSVELETKEKELVVIEKKGFFIQILNKIKNLFPKRKY